MKPLRILITNNTLGPRAGSELYVRDIAAALQRRGHTPIAYSTALGAVADDIRRAGVPVVDNLDNIGAVPDVIHGHHHVETMTALLRFPTVPALFVCHGWVPWEETPCRFPRIRRWLAVSGPAYDRLVFEHGIPEERVRILQTFVDLQRFQPREPLPPRPRRALYMNGAVRPDSPMLPAVREACAAEGIRLDVISAQLGNACSDPEARLTGYDLVFAVGRSAHEALAVGCAVVVTRAAVGGPMVTAAELDRLRRENFGVRVAGAAPSAAAVRAEIARYDQTDAAEVTRRVRARCGLESAVDELEALYAEIVAEVVPSDPDEEMRAASEYVRRLGERAKERDRATAERDELSRRIAALRGRGIWARLWNRGPSG